MDPFGMSLGALPLLSQAETRSISAENPTPASGAAARARHRPRTTPRRT